MAAGEDVATCALEVSLGRFETGNPSNWSAKEWAVLDRFQRLFLQYHTVNTKEYIDDVICMFALGGWKLDDLLRQVEAVPSEHLAACLWYDWAGRCASGMENIWITAFWEREDAARMLAFYTSDALYEKMEVLALDDRTDPALADKASAVASIIRP